MKSLNSYPPTTGCPCHLAYSGGSSRFWLGLYVWVSEGQRSNTQSTSKAVERAAKPPQRVGRKKRGDKHYPNKERAECEKIFHIPPVCLTRTLHDKPRHNVKKFFTNTRQFLPAESFRLCRKRTGYVDGHQYDLAASGH